MPKIPRRISRQIDWRTIVATIIIFILPLAIAFSAYAHGGNSHHGDVIISPSAAAVGGENPAQRGLPSVAVFFLLGFLGSGHCVGMCGPFVMAYTNRADNRATDHLYYGLGRSTTYAFLGTIVSLVGGVVRDFLGWRPLLLIVAGLLTIILAAIELRLLRWRLPDLTTSTFYRRTIEKLLDNQSAHRNYLLGVVLGFIPCGLTALALSFALVQPVTLSAVGMFGFGLGTLPAMVGFGMLIQRLKIPKLRRYIALLMAILGALTVWLGFFQIGWLPEPPQTAFLSRLHPHQLPPARKLAD
jgi:uncharacterized protein